MSRRAIAGAAAWTVPVVLLTASSPAAAASSRGVLSNSPSSVTLTAGTSQTVRITTTPVTENLALGVSVEPAGALTWVPNPTVTLSAVGCASIRFSTALTEAQEVAVTVTAPGFEPAIFPVFIEAPASVPTLTAPDAPVNLARTLPMLDHRQAFTATLAESDGTPIHNETVTLAPPRRRRSSPAAGTPRTPPWSSSSSDLSRTSLGRICLPIPEYRRSGASLGVHVPRHQWRA